MSHYYDENAKLIGGATLREARKNNLYPSVTTIMNVMSKPVIENWKISETIQTTINIPFDEEENNIYEYIQKIKQITTARSLVGAKFGTVVHEGIAILLEGGEFFKKKYNENELTAIHNTFNLIKEITKKIDKVEYSFVNKILKYAGTIDLICTLKTGEVALIDYKTQKFKESNKKYNAYPEWRTQLGAYNISLPEFNITKFYSVVINSLDDNEAILHEWKTEEIDVGLNIFLSCLDLFCLTKNFNIG